MVIVGATDAWPALDPSSPRCWYGRSCHSQAESYNGDVDVDVNIGTDSPVVSESRLDNDAVGDVATTAAPSVDSDGNAANSSGMTYLQENDSITPYITPQQCDSRTDGLDSHNVDGQSVTRSVTLDFSYLKRVAGFRLVPVELGFSYTSEDWSQRLMPLASFIARDLEQPYMQQRDDTVEGKKSSIDRELMLSSTSSSIASSASSDSASSAFISCRLPTIPIPSPWIDALCEQSSNSACGNGGRISSPAGVSSSSSSMQDPVSAPSSPPLPKSKSKSKSKIKGYLAQHRLFQQIPPLMRDIQIPDYCTLPSTTSVTDSVTDNVTDSGEALSTSSFANGYSSDKTQRQSSSSSSSSSLLGPTINAWFGPAGTVSPLHYVRSCSNRCHRR